MAVTEQSARAARALDALYRRHSAEIYRYAYAVLGNHADAEDVTQATFVNALRALERGEKPRKPANWLIVIAHNLMRQRFRQAAARPVEVVLERELPAAAPDDDADGPSVEELVQALGRIPPTQREALVMREFEGRSYAEIAEILGVTTSALETLVFRARRSLAEELENVVTCARAEQELSRLFDGRLSRKERRRLREHLKTCPRCARFEIVQRRQRRALKGLALVPVPASLTLLKGHSAAAATVPTIGGAAVAAGGASTGGTVAGGLALGGVAAKAAAVVAAVGIAGGVGYEGIQQIDSTPRHAPPPAAAKPHTGSSPKAHSAQGRARGRSAVAHERAARAAARGRARAASAPGHVRTAGASVSHGRATAPSASKAATRRVVPAAAASHTLRPTAGRPTREKPTVAYVRRARGKAAKAKRTPRAAAAAPGRSSGTTGRSTTP